MQFLNALGSEDEQKSKVERSVHDNGDEQATRSGVQERQTEARQAGSQYTEPTLVDVAEPEQQRRCHYDLGRTEIRERGEIEEEKATKDDLFRNASAEGNEREPTAFRSRDGDQGPDHFEQAPQLPVSDKVKENDGCGKDNGQYGEHATRVVPRDRTCKSPPVAELSRASKARERSECAPAVGCRRSGKSECVHPLVLTRVAVATGDT